MHALSNSAIIDQNDAVFHRNHAIRNLTTNLNTSEQHGLMNQNNIVSEENNDEEFDTQKANAKHRKTTIADAINVVDQSNKKKTSSRLVVKKKKKKGKKGKGTGNDLLYI